MTSEPTQPDPTSLDRAALLERVQRSWEKLQATVRGLDDAQQAAPGADGWSVSDHLAHVADWEEYLVALLAGRDPLSAVGIPGGQRMDTDAMNAILHERHAGLSPAEARRLLDETHARTVACIEALDDADLARPYASYLPSTTNPERDEPVIHWIVGNTADHFDEHRQWISEMAPAERAG